MISFLQNTDIENMNNFLKNNNIELILASHSPRRKWILEQSGFLFSTYPPNFNEDQFLENLTSIIKLPGIWEVKEKNHKDLIHEICTNLAIQKALIVYNDLKQKKEKFIILSSDTLVYYNQFFLTKPKNKEEAFTMLKFLSGKTHTVVTAHCVVNQEKIILTKDVMTLVTFRKLSEKQINNYLEKEEPYDKAGSYAIQGDASIFIDSIVGDYLNVVGLSLNAVIFLLNQIQI